MTLKEKILFHQVHPAKLATDIGAAVISLYFFWQHDLVVGLLIHLIPPPIGSFVVIRFANLEHYKNSQLGAYLVRYMTPTAQTTRLLAISTLSSASASSSQPGPTVLCCHRTAPDRVVSPKAGMCRRSRLHHVAPVADGACLKVLATSLGCPATGISQGSTH
jgi:hypothetical protein